MKVLDMHCDTISKLYQEKGELYCNEGHVSLQKMREGDYLLQNFALFVCQDEVKNPFEAALEMTDLYYVELKKNENIIAPVFEYEDIQNHRESGKISSILTLEEGAVLKGKMEYLRIFHRLGVRMIALTWNFENEFGAPNFLFNEKGIPEFSKRNSKGLTSFGKELVQEMEELGMIIDVSHLSDGGFWDVVKYTSKPFVASHSNAAAVCNVPRNLTDDMIRKLAERGGVLGLNFCGIFLNKAAEDNPFYQSAGMIEDMKAHLKHVINVGGIEACGLGSDFDGIPVAPEIADASRMQMLAEALENEGFTYGEIEKIFYKNALRVYKEAF